MNMMLRKNVLQKTAAMAAVCLSMSSVARADLITYFNFEDSSTTSNTPPNLVSDPPGLQTSTITTNFDPGQGATQTTLNLTTFGGTTLNIAPGNVQGTNRALAVLGGDDADPVTAGVQPENNGRFIQFGANTTGFQNIMVSFATQRTSTGFTGNIFQFSLDGATFTDFATYTPGTDFAANATPPASTNTLQLFDLSSITGLNNNAASAFRIVFNGATSAAGNNRLDNIQVNGAAVGVTAVPEPGTVTLMLLGLAGVGGAARKRKKAEREAAESLVSA